MSCKHVAGRRSRSPLASRQVSSNLLFYDVHTFEDAPVGWVRDAYYLRRYRSIHVALNFGRA